MADADARPAASSISRRWRAPPAWSRCRARRASPIARCCSPRSRTATRVVRGLLDADDVERMLDALATLGIAHRARARDARLRRARAGRRAFPVKSARLHLGNAGTAFRPLTAVLAFAGGHYELSGVARMHERPIGDLVDALRALGADIRYLGNAGFPPLAIGPDRPASARAPRSRHGARRRVEPVHLGAADGAAARHGDGGRRDRRSTSRASSISKPYVAITTNLMHRFGVAVAQDDWRSFRVPAGARYREPGRDPRRGRRVVGLVLPGGGRASAAARFASPASAARSIQGDVAFADVLARMGAAIERGDDWIEARAGRGASRASRSTASRFPMRR